MGQQEAGRLQCFTYWQFSPLGSTVHTVPPTSSVDSRSTRSLQDSHDDACHINTTIINNAVHENDTKKTPVFGSKSMTGTDMPLPTTNHTGSRHDLDLDLLTSKCGRFIWVVNLLKFPQWFARYCVDKLHGQTHTHTHSPKTKCLQWIIRGDGIEQVSNPS